MTVSELPMIASPQIFKATLAGISYRFRTRWNDVSRCWVMDVFDSNEVLMIGGLALVTGADLISQFEYLGIGGQIVVQTDGDKDIVPDYNSLGSTGHVYFLT
jgi:Domain of unknown function (DUF6983)